MRSFEKKKILEYIFVEYYYLVFETELASTRLVGEQKLSKNVKQYWRWNELLHFTVFDFLGIAKGIATYNSIEICQSQKPQGLVA